MRTFTVDERRARLAIRHALSPEHRAGDVREAANRVVCLHATDPATVYLSAWARIEAMSIADLDEALYVERVLVKHLAMRRTLFVVDRDLLGVLQAAASDRVAGQESRRLIGEVEKAGLVPDGATWLVESQAATLAALAEVGEATAAELRDLVPSLQGATTYALDKPYGGSAPVAPRVLTTLSAAGLVVRASNTGTWSTSRPRWALTEDWLGARPVAPPAADALATLVRLWLASFGPATVADIKWWLGGTLTATRVALATIGAVAVDLHGSPGVALPDDLDETPAVGPWAALLPGLDPTTMGWQERGWYLGKHRADIFDSVGNGGPTAWVNGRIVGGWRQRDDKRVELLLLERVSRDERRLLASEADRLSEWLGDARPLPRFPSPLSKRVGSG